MTSLEHIGGTTWGPQVRCLWQRDCFPKGDWQALLRMRGERIIHEARRENSGLRKVDHPELAVLIDRKIAWVHICIVA